MAFPTVTVEVALTTDPGATPTWTDISAYLEDSIATWRGRSQETDQYRTGTLELSLQNEDRRFDPTNTAGPYYPNVLPMRKIRVRATYSATTYDLFTGYVDGWDQGYEHPGVAHCTVRASDMMKVLAQIDMPTSAYMVEVKADSPVAWYRLGDPVGATQLRDSAGINHLPIEVTPTLGVAGLTVRDADTAASFSTTLEGAQRQGAPTVTGPPMTFEMIYRGPFGSGLGFYGEVGLASSPLRGWSVQYNGGTNKVDLTLITAAATGTVSTTSGLTDSNPHHIAFTWDAGGSVRAYFDGVLQTTGSVAVGTFPSSVYAILGAGRASVSGTSAVTGTWDEIAIYNTALSATRIAAHAAARATAWSGDLSGARINRLLDAAGIPTADRNIDTGTAVLQGADVGGTLLSMLQAVERTEQGRLFVTGDGKLRFIGRAALIQAPYTTSQATFGDSGAELEYGDLQYRYDDQSIVNEVTVSRANGVAQTASDPTSKTRYLRRTMVVDGLLHSSDDTSLDLANYLLAHYKDPLLRATQLKLEPDAGNETTHYPQVLGRELAQRVTVLRRPQSVGAAISQESLIESVAHRISRGVHWETTWDLSPADTQSYGVWDSSVALWDTARWSF